tara:strand:- start:88 stop:1011 length:924 start_codon:yes stop_codon:yes gene_type:complete
MKKDFISEHFEKKGLLLGGQKDLKIENLKYQSVVNDFEEYGLIIFRDFNNDPKKITSVTDLYTQSYANDAPRREKSAGEKNFNTVDVGFGDGDHEIEMPLHSEASYSPSWPEIIWFFCITESEQGGETTLCDGVKLWKNLSSNTKNFFLSNPICFDLEFPILEKKLGKGRRPWMLNSQGSSDGYIDWDTGKFYVKQIRFAVHETRHPEVLAFSNHLMVIPGQDPQIKKWTTLKGNPVPSDIMEEIRSKSNDLTYDHKWKKGDLVMIDNKRFMHGRRQYNKKDKRQIAIAQTLRANFGYGSTRRKKYS